MRIRTILQSREEVGGSFRRFCVSRATFPSRLSSRAVAAEHVEQGDVQAPALIFTCRGCLTRRLLTMVADRSAVKPSWRLDWGHIATSESLSSNMRHDDGVIFYGQRGSSDVHGLVSVASSGMIFESTLPIAVLDLEKQGTR